MIDSPQPPDVTASAKAWAETAAHFAKGRDYYRGLVVQIGEMLGVEAKTQDDGGVVPDVLCAKVPEVVASTLARLRHERACRKKLAALVRAYGLGPGGQLCGVLDESAELDGVKPCE